MQHGFFVTIGRSGSYLKLSVFFKALCKNVEKSEFARKQTILFEPLFLEQTRIQVDLPVISRVPITKADYGLGGVLCNDEKAIMKTYITGRDNGGGGIPNMVIQHK
tara:strand:+ start:94 stop:411 length:318 start_codon:yes stop_codon:yes gene_type:complete